LQISKKSFVIYHSLFGQAVVVGKNIVNLIQRFNLGIDFLCVFSKTEISTYREAILDLKKRGFLVKKGLNERLFLKKNQDRFKQRLSKNPARFIDFLRLEMSSFCNFRCLHCFAQKIYDWRKGRLMSFPVSRQAIDGFVNILRRGHKKSGIVSFWGGEPLLNWEVIQQITEYTEAVSKNTLPKIQFNIVTNGSLLNNHIISFMKKHKFTIRLSLDGLKKENDLFRKFVNGKGTFKYITNAMNRLSKLNKSFSIELCLNDYNFDILEKVIDFLWDRYKPTAIVISPITHQRAVLPFDTHSSVEKARRCVEIYVYARKKGIPINPAEGLDLSGIALKSKFIPRHACNGLYSSLYVNPSGVVYGCELKIKRPLGRVKELEKVPWGRNYRYAAMRMISKIKGCKGCEIEGFCAGGCAGIAEFYSGDIYDTSHPLFQSFYCDFRRQLFREMLKFTAKNPNYLKKNI